MRRFVKNKITEYIEDLLKGHKLLETAFLQKDTERILTLSAGCQETAIRIGNTIEAEAVLSKEEKAYGEADRN